MIFGLLEPVRANQFPCGVSSETYFWSLSFHLNGRSFLLPDTVGSSRSNSMVPGRASDQSVSVTSRLTGGSNGNAKGKTPATVPSGRTKTALGSFGAGDPGGNELSTS